MVLKVCQLCAVDFTLARFLLPLIDGMQACGWHVTTVCSDGPEVLSLRSRGYRIHTIPIARSMKPWLAIRSLIQLVFFLHHERFDVLHAHTPVAALIGRFAAYIARVPLIIYTAHGFYFHDEMSSFKRIFFLLLERLAGSVTDLLFCQSAEDALTAVRNHIVPASRLLTIGNGVDPRRFDPLLINNLPSLRSSLSIPHDAFVVGFIGRQVIEKGIADFLKAMTGLSMHFPDLWVLLIGDRLPSDHQQGVDDEIQHAKGIMGPRLVSLGYRDDIPELLALMDVFCLPSWREGMPRTIIEAMMMGKPVLATDIRGSREEVVHGQTGFLIPIRSPSRIAMEVKRLLLNRDLASQLGDAGRVRALSHFDESKIVQLQIKRISREVSTRHPCP